MIDFNKKKISSGPPPSQRPPKIERTPKEGSKFRGTILGFMQRHFIWTAIIVVVLVAGAKMVWGIATLAEEFTVKEIVLSAFSEKIETDENNHTNILLLGTGTEEHDGVNLTDTIIVASIDHDLSTVSMLSIPRDLYVEIDELYGGNRINSVLELVAEQYMYDEGMREEAAYHRSYEVLKDTISEIIGIPIHYYARVNFNGFVDVVDALGGIDVNVENAIYDPYYPEEDGSIGYITFQIDEGPQHLDGETALKFVRSRKTTSDFDRASRQQIVITAIKDKAMSLGILANPSKLKKLYNAYDDNFDTDLEWDEMVYLAKISEKFDRENVSSWVLNDNPLTVGGFLYTPEREQYNGAFVLLPYTEDYSDIQMFANLVLMHPEVHANPKTYQILNGTGLNGIATETMYFLGRFGFDIVRFGNAANKEVQVTRIIPLTALLSGQDPLTIPEEEPMATLTSTFIPAGFITTEIPEEYLPVEWTTEADVILELGFDYAEWMQANPQHFY